MRDYLTIGSTPPDEDCAQVGNENYHSRSIIESKVYVAQLRRLLGEEPVGAQLRRKGFEHDFGTYHEVVCYFDDSIQETVDYAYKCESDGPQNWDEIALKELKEAGYYLSKESVK